MTYRSALDWMFSQLPMYQREGAAAYKADLVRTEQLMKLLGQPQQGFTSVHIAGTNGKGSVAHMMFKLLQQAGFRVALYTSPHFHDFRERIRINNELIAEEEVVAFVDRYKDDLESMQLSFFEMTVGLAFDYFRQQKVDIAIIETGLGGRLDSTNVVSPLLSVITNISFDHMRFLGNDLKSIAGEKAGIIKPSTAVVIGETHKETEMVFNEIARRNHSDIYYADQVFDLKEVQQPQQADRSIFDVWKNNEIYLESLEMNMMPLYQHKNLKTSLMGLELIKPSFPWSESDLRASLSELRVPGRWHKIGEHPLVICDTAHNQAGITEVLLQLQRIPYQQLHIVIGLVKDKDGFGLLQMLPKSARYYFCKPDIPRGLDDETLKQLGHKAGLNGLNYNSVREAYYSAQNNAIAGDLILITGSNFVVAEIL